MPNEIARIVRPCFKATLRSSSLRGGSGGGNRIKNISKPTLLQRYGKIKTHHNLQDFFATFVMIIRKITPCKSPAGR